MKRSKLALISAVGLVLLIEATYIFVVLLNIPTNDEMWILNWNPPPKENFMPIVISYPDSMFRPFYGENAPNCTVKFLLQYDGTLKENTHVKIINATCTSFVPYNITVSVGIPQAIRYDLKETIGNTENLTMEWGGTNILTFHDNYVPVVGKSFEPVVNYHPIKNQSHQDIYFPVAGDYSPIIMIAPKDDPYNPILYRFDQIKIHVATATEVEQERIGEANLGLTGALFGFSFIGGFALIYELTKKEKTEVSAQLTS